MTRIEHLKIALGLMAEPVVPKQLLVLDGVRTAPDMISLIALELRAQTDTEIKVYGEFRKSIRPQSLRAGDTFTLETKDTP
jgi:hypothetical protein